MKSLHFFVVLFAITNAVLYCCLVPLWEGFDEPFHYGYIQSLSVRHEMPRLGHSSVSREIERSLHLVPLSFILKRNITGTVAFEDWFHFSQEKRADRKAALLISRSEDQVASTNLRNYEAQQTPLSYLALAPFDLTWRALPLPGRILRLRLVIAVLATLALALGAYRLGSLLGLRPIFCAAFAVCLFQIQILSAAIYHVANDWLSIVALTWFAVLLVQLLGRSPVSLVTVLALAFITAIGLLAKAYFLAFLPVFALALLYARYRGRTSTRDSAIAVFVLLLLTAPWYLRNLVQFGSLAGMQENVKGVRHADVLEAFTRIHWSKTLIESARWGLWTGNESHIAFSQATLNLQLLLFAAGGLLYVIQLRKTTVAELALIFAAVMFFLALVYDLCVTWSDTHGIQNTFGPYYSPCLLIPLLALFFLGLQRSALLGRLVAIALVALSAWISLLTYFVKLIPSYGGLIGKGTLAATWHWWTAAPKQILTDTVLGPIHFVYANFAVYVVLVICLASALIRSLAQKEGAR